MKMHLDTTAGAHRITAYGSGYVTVDDKRIERAFVVTPETLISDWGPADMAELDQAALEVITLLRPSMVLLGTGLEHRFPSAALLAPLLAQGIGIEAMTTAAACRTYNILVAEGRQVAAGLFVS